MGLRMVYKIESVKVKGKHGAHGVMNLKFMGRVNWMINVLIDFALESFGWLTKVCKKLMDFERNGVKIIERIRGNFKDIR